MTAGGGAGAGERALDHLSPEACRELLAGAQVGRVGVVAEAGRILIEPVTYVLDGETIVFRTDEGAKLAALGGGSVTFQVDEIDPLHRTGWSVLVHGAASEVTPQAVRDVDLEAWAPGAKDHWVRVVPVELSGRRLVVRLGELDPRGYR
ncbi:MAG TPA: pyridoxamine 5'-phosphate oxidase family protein [Acidimicrobiales bacterium]|nr:pyridoxamine 5'-phosphate oxidase family protein [Acidimicrobiales bacterium]